MRIKLSVIVVSVLSLVGSLYSVQAQNAHCSIDVQPIVAELIAAQAAAASGKQEDALQQISDAKADLEAIEDNCSVAPAAVVIPPLTATFSAPDDSFTFKYPEGWLTGEFAPTLKMFGVGGRALIGNNESSLAALTKNVDETQFTEADQAAFIIGGSANTVLYSLGLYDETSVPKDLSDVKALTEYIQLAIKDGPLFAEIGDPVYAEKSAQFSFSDKAFEGIVLLKQLDDDKYAFMLMLGGKGTSTATTALAEAIHATIQ